MRITDGLSPKKVFYYFEEISKIPRVRATQKAISDYCVRFAESHGFKCLQDDSNNCIIFAPAVGCDKAEPILLAGHLDMVCEKSPRLHQGYGKKRESTLRLTATIFRRWALHSEPMTESPLP